MCKKKPPLYLPGYPSGRSSTCDEKFGNRKWQNEALVFIETLIVLLNTDASHLSQFFPISVSICEAPLLQLHLRRCKRKLHLGARIGTSADTFK